MNSDFFTGLSLIMHGPAGGCACGRPAQKSNAGELDGRLDGAVVGLFGAAFALPVFTMQKLVRKRTAGLAEEVPVGLTTSSFSCDVRNFIEASVL